MRGKAASGIHNHAAAGITPAYAGKSFVKFGTTEMCKGSPPRMRGKARPWRKHKQEARITPAYAGKSVLRLNHTHINKDHPRVCGEKFTLKCGPTCSLGSPPRMRGKGTYQVRYWAIGGITPAYAGKSGYLVGAFSNFWDHPRVCGEKQKDAPAALKSLGSPPRMRGKD